MLLPQKRCNTLEVGMLTRGSRDKDRAYKLMHKAYEFLGAVIDDERIRRFRYSGANLAPNLSMKITRVR